jgi:hypothetical protein
MIGAMKTRLNGPKEVGHVVRGDSFIAQFWVRDASPHVLPLRLGASAALTVVSSSHVRLQWPALNIARYRFQLCAAFNGLCFGRLPPALPSMACMALLKPRPFFL